MLEAYLYKDIYWEENNLRLRYLGYLMDCGYPPRVAIFEATKSLDALDPHWITTEIHALRQRMSLREGEGPHTLRELWHLKAYVEGLLHAKGFLWTIDID